MAAVILENEDLNNERFDSLEGMDEGTTLEAQEPEQGNPEPPAAPESQVHHDLYLSLSLAILQELVLNGLGTMSVVEQKQRKLTLSNTGSFIFTFSTILRYGV